MLQDVGLRYIQHSTDASGLRDALDEDLIHFCTFKLVWHGNLNTWKLEFEKRMSTNTEGVRKILGGAHQEKFPTLEAFKTTILSKISSKL